MLQLCQENEDRILCSENVSNALSCKKNKTPKNEHSKHDKKGLSIIKPTKEHTYLSRQISLLLSFLSIIYSDKIKFLLVKTTTNNHLWHMIFF